MLASRRYLDVIYNQCALEPFPVPPVRAIPRASSRANISRNRGRVIRMVRRSGNRTPLASNAASAISLIDALTTLRCFWLNSSNQPIITAFGRALLLACQPPT